jgi:signal transduction histidine kinase
MFEVEDDGHGFDPATAKRGAGLTNMADRLDSLGGHLVVGSELGRGVQIQASLPVAQMVPVV